MREKTILANREQVANFFGLTKTAVSRWMEEGCPGEQGNYDLFEIVKWWVKNKELAKQLREQRRELENSVDSGELKKRRLEQQIRAEELDYAIKIGELIPLEHCMLILTTHGSYFRKAGELLRRAYGHDAQQIVLDAIEDADKSISQHIDDQSAVKN